MVSANRLNRVGILSRFSTSRTRGSDDWCRIGYYVVCRVDWPPSGNGIEASCPGAVILPMEALRVAQGPHLSVPPGDWGSGRGATSTVGPRKCKRMVGYLGLEFLAFSNTLKSREKGGHLIRERRLWIVVFFFNIFISIFRIDLLPLLIIF